MELTKSPRQIFSMDVDINVQHTLYTIGRKTDDLTETGGFNHRIKFTKMFLEQSLLKLLSEKLRPKIIQKGIYDLTDINKGIFY